MKSSWNKGGTSWSKGLHLSESHRAKIGAANRGRKYSKEAVEKMKTYLKPPSQLGLRRRPESLRTGSKCNFWKGGITPANESLRRSANFKAWRNAVFARDNWTCQKYGIRGGKLHPHHILNFSDHPALRFSVDNGATLSEKAHREFHKIYGLRNNTREQLVEFLAMSP